jgi:subtilisin family serine protease
VSAFDARGEPYASGSLGDYVDLAAPGVEVLTTLPEARYGAQTGSSIAAAHVSAAAALLLELRPSLSPRELRQILLGSAREQRPLRLDACRAVEKVVGESLSCPR